MSNLTRTIPIEQPSSKSSKRHSISHKNTKSSTSLSTKERVEKNTLINEECRYENRQYFQKILQNLFRLLDNLRQSSSRYVIWQQTKTERKSIEGRNENLETALKQTIKMETYCDNSKRSLRISGLLFNQIDHQFDVMKQSLTQIFNLLHYHFYSSSQNSPSTSSNSTMSLLLFCGICGNRLSISENVEGVCFMCPSCPFKQPLSQSVSQRRYPQMKEVDDVIGGSEAWKNVDSTEEKCPKCEHDRAFFMQMQLRSADEPSTTFYRCCNSECSHQWNDQ
ncbi:hypothetical protein SNEBB_008192 [Seison nebaliae]|nr:hypothetical protein SNEBB_008192 [Seison nebaliae]